VIGSARDASETMKNSNKQAMLLLLIRFLLFSFNEMTILVVGYENWLFMKRENIPYGMTFIPFPS